MNKHKMKYYLRKIGRNLIFATPPLIIVILTGCLFYAVMTILSYRMERAERIQAEQLEEYNAEMLIHQIRNAGNYGINLNGNPEL